MGVHANAKVEGLARRSDMLEGSTAGCALPAGEAQQLGGRRRLLQLDERGTGAIEATDVKDQLDEALRALGMRKGQALEALQLLQEQRAREADSGTSSWA